MSTSDYALIISIVSLLIALGALIWNVWQKFIFVRPDIQVTFSLGNVLMPENDDFYRPNGRKLLVVTATNMGPGPAILTACIVKLRPSTFKFRAQVGMLNPIDGNPASTIPQCAGPFGGGLPAKIEAAESKSFYFPYENEGFLRERILSVGINDSYRRNNWCRKSDVASVMRHYRNDFSSGRKESE